MSRLLLFLLWVLPAVGMPAEKPIGKATLLAGTAASVGKNLITLQDAHFYRALQRLVEGGGEDPLALETGEALRRTVQKMAFEDMVYQEMKSLQLSDPVPKAEAEKIVREQRAKGRDAVWGRVLTRFGKKESQAEAQLLKSLQVERFIQKKAETLTPIITETEAEKYYQQNRAKLASGSFESLKPNLIALMKKDKMQKGLEEWVKTLKEKYQVTNYLEGS